MKQVLTIGLIIALMLSAGCSSLQGLDSNSTTTPTTTTAVDSITTSTTESPSTTSADDGSLVTTEENSEETSTQAPTSDETQTQQPTSESTSTSTSTPESTTEPTPNETTTPNSEKSEDDFRDKFLTQIESSDISVVKCANHSGSTFVVYDTQYVTDTDAQHEEIDVVIKSFASIVAEGWQTSSVKATIQDGKGEPLAHYQIEREWVEEYNQGEISYEELKENVDETTDWIYNSPSESPPTTTPDDGVENKTWDDRFKETVEAEEPGIDVVSVETIDGVTYIDYKPKETAEDEIPYNIEAVVRSYIGTIDASKVEGGGWRTHKLEATILDQDGEKIDDYFVPDSLIRRYDSGVISWDKMMELVLEQLDNTDVE